MENEKLKEQKIKKTTGEVQDRPNKKEDAPFGERPRCLMKGGSYLLSRIALQYHRRKRA